MPPVFSIENQEGRLVECRIRSPIELPDVKAFGDRLKSVLASASAAATSQGGKVVVCVELRAANVFPPDVSDGFIQLMRVDNPMIERSAFLVGDSALFSLQVERMIRDAKNTARRSFRDPATLEAWLGEALSPLEKARLGAFLGAQSSTS